MENANIIRKIIREQLRKINEMSWESGYYPPGAEHDPSAPWNEEPSPEIEFTADYDNQKFLLLSSDDFLMNCFPLYFLFNSINFKFLLPF